jgi:hypothetical protein
MRCRTDREETRLRLLTPKENPMNKPLTQTDLESAMTLDDAERTRCEIWTRVMGYHRPMASFNTGKKGEAAERVYFSEARAHLG